MADESLAMLMENQWQAQVKGIEETLVSLINPLKQHSRVKDTRVLGAIGVIETKQAVNMEKIQALFVKQGVWIRPFGKLIYLMPPFISSNEDLETLVNAIRLALARDECFQ